MDDHPISIDQAKALLSGELGDVYRRILADCCAPLFWFEVAHGPSKIKHNGTLTFVRTPKALIGVTAGHVLKQLAEDRKAGALRIQVMNEVVDDLLDRVIDASDALDLATFALDEALIARLGKTPLGMWPPRPPMEGRGILLAGYPAGERIDHGGTVNFGLFTALGVARTVTHWQITWKIEPEFNLADQKIPAPPPEYDFGGISGGPLLSWFESEQHVAHHCLSGIVVEHPDYAKNADFAPIERIVAVRADVISESGKIIPI